MANVLYGALTFSCRQRPGDRGVGPANQMLHNPTAYLRFGFASLPRTSGAFTLTDLSPCLGPGTFIECLLYARSCVRAREMKRPRHREAALGVASWAKTMDSATLCLAQKTLTTAEAAPGLSSGLTWTVL